MATLHDFSAVLRSRQAPLPVADAHVQHIADAARAVLELVTATPRSAATPVDIDAIGALIADWASQLAILVDGEQRLAAQYINRLAVMMREQARSQDVLRVEVLAWAVLRAVEQLQQAG